MISVFGRIQQNDADREIPAVACIEEACVFVMIEVTFVPRKNIFRFWGHGLLDLLKALSLQNLQKFEFSFDREWRSDQIPL